MRNVKDLLGTAALVTVLFLLPLPQTRGSGPRSGDCGLHVGAAAVDLQADDGMIIGGGIHPGRAQGQEGQLRAVAVVLEKPGAPPESATLDRDYHKEFNQRFVLVTSRNIEEPTGGPKKLARAR